MNRTARLLVVLVVVALVAWQQGGAQVVNSIGEENMKVEQGLKPQPKKAESPYIADLDTETPYFQAIDSAQTYIYSHDWPIAEQWLLKAIRLEPENPNNSLLLSNIATLQRYQGRLADAVKNYSFALDMTPHAVTMACSRTVLPTPPSTSCHAACGWTSSLVHKLSHRAVPTPTTGLTRRWPHAMPPR